MRGQARWGACNGHLGKRSERISGRSRIDRRDRVERDHCRHRASASERESRELTVGLSHDVSTVLGIGRQRGSQPRANTSITIMRAPQRGHGQGSTRRASGVISGCFCGSAGGTSGRRLSLDNEARDGREVGFA